MCEGESEGCEITEYKIGTGETNMNPILRKGELAMQYYKTNEYFMQFNRMQKRKKI